MSKKSKKKGFEYDPEWAKAKQVCRLNMEDIRMAKELGISPRSLMKNNPSKSQQWKLPVKFWIRDLYDKMLERREARLARKQVAHSGSPAAPRSAVHEEKATTVSKRVEHSDRSCIVGDLMDEPSISQSEPSADEATAHSLDNIPF